jgi:beta-glucanase (GH16 family)
MSYPEEPRPTGAHPRHAAPSSRLLMAGAAAAVAAVLTGVVAAVALTGPGHPHRVSYAGPNAGPNAAPAVSAGVDPAAGRPSVPVAPPSGPASAGPASASVSPAPSAGRSAPRPGATTPKPATTTKAVSGVPAPPAGFRLTFGDSFGGAAGTGLNTGKYRYDTGPGSKFGTGEIETMTDSTRNVFHDGDGHLVLKALHSGSDPAQGWTSGRFETEAATFGADKGGVVRMQASIQQPDVTKTTGAGYWPAFWMLGNGLRNGGTWPAIGEVDILEDVNGRGSVFGTLHCGTNPGGPCNESSGVGSGEHACPGCQTGFHTYAVEIDRSTSPERIRWYLDGDNYFTLTEDRVGASAWAAAVDHPFFIIFDLAMGGGFPGAFGGGPNADTVSGGAMKIDYLAVYNKR